MRRTSFANSRGATVVGQHVRRPCDPPWAFKTSLWLADDQELTCALLWLIKYISIVHCAQTNWAPEVTGSMDRRRLHQIQKDADSARSQTLSMACDRILPVMPRQERNLVRDEVGKPRQPTSMLKKWTRQPALSHTTTKSSYFLLFPLMRIQDVSLQRNSQLSNYHLLLGV